MQAHPDWQVLNRGVNGERSDQIRARFARDAAQAKPAVVVIIAGVNDIYQGRSAESVERELEAMYDAARAAKIVVVAGSIIPFNTATADQNARMHRGQRLDPRAMRRASRRRGVLRHARGGRRAGTTRPAGVLSRRPSPVSRRLQTDGRRRSNRPIQTALSPRATPRPAVAVS